MVVNHFCFLSKPALDVMALLLNIIIFFACDYLDYVLCEPTVTHSCHILIINSINDNYLSSPMLHDQWRPANL